MSSKDTVHLPLEWPQVIPCKLEPTEVVYCLYMPVSIPGQKGIVSFEGRKDLAFVEPMLRMIEKNEPDRFRDEYVYITIKRMIIGPSISANRPGWHSDGFGTDDINYVWYNCLPTLMVARPFTVSTDHVQSMIEFDDQAEKSVAAHYTIPPGNIIRLTPNMVHRVQLADEDMMRTFVKVTISKDQFNLAGNSTHPEISEWPMFPRAHVRNDPARAQLDFKDEPPPPAPSLRTSPCTDPDCGCMTPSFTEPFEALRFLARRLKNAGVNDIVAKSYARDLEAIIAKLDTPNWQTFIASEDMVDRILAAPLGRTTIGNRVCCEVTAAELKPALLTALQEELTLVEQKARK